MHQLSILTAPTYLWLYMYIAKLYDCRQHWQMISIFFFTCVLFTPAPFKKYIYIYIWIPRITSKSVTMKDNSHWKCDVLVCVWYQPDKHARNKHAYKKKPHIFMIKLKLTVNSISDMNNSHSTSFEIQELLNIPLCVFWRIFNDKLKKIYQNYTF